MPKVSTSTRRSSHQDGKKRSKNRGHQYLDATKVRKLRKTRFRGIVEEVIEPVESGKPRLLRRTPKVDMRRSYLIPEPMFVDPVNDNQTSAATTPPEPSTSMPHAASIPGSFQEAVWSPASQFQDTEFFQNNMNDPEAFHFHQQEIQNHFYLGSTDDDVDMKSVREATMEPPDYSVPMVWTSESESIQPQPEEQIFYSQVGQVVDNIDQHQTYTLHNSRVSWASMVSIPKFVAVLVVNHIETVCLFQPMENESINHMYQSEFNHPVDPLAAWETLSKIAGTPQSPVAIPEVINSTSHRSDEQRPDKAQGIPGTSKSRTTIPEIIESTPNQCDEQQPHKEPSKITKPHIPICQDCQPGKQLEQNRPYLHPLSHPRGYTKFVTISGESDESRIVWPKPGRRCERPPVGLGMGSVARLVSPLFYVICFLQLPTDFSQKRVELEGCAPPQVEHRRPQREDFQPVFARTCSPDLEVQAQVIPRRQRHCEPDTSKLKALPIQKRSVKYQDHHQPQPAAESPRTPTEWNFTRLLPSFTSLVDRFNKFF